MGLIPGRGTEIPYAVQHGQEQNLKKKKPYGKTRMNFLAHPVLFTEPWAGLGGKLNALS